MRGRLSLAAAVVSITLMVAGGAPPAAAASSVSSCGTLAAPGTYVLGSDLNVGASCFVITSNNVTLDLAGHTVSCNDAGFLGSCQVAGFGPIGVDVRPGLTGVTVKGPGVLAGFDNGVLFNNSDGTITNLTVTAPSCAPGGCSRPVSNGIVVAGRLHLDGSVDLGPARVSAVGNRIRNHGRGIALLGAQCGSGCTAYGNIVTESGGDECNGILLSGTSGYALVGNQVHGNGAGDCFPPGGIVVGDGSTGNIVTGNDASANIGFGIAVGPGTSGNTIAANTARGNTFVDLQAVPGTINVWTDSNVCNTEGGAVPPTVCNPGE